MKKYKQIIIFLAVVFFAFPLIMHGATVEVPNPLPVKSFPELINLIVNFVLKVALAVAPIVFLYAGITFYTAQGDPSKAKKAFEIIKFAIIGLVLILIASGITSVIKDVMGVKGY